MKNNNFFLNLEAFYGGYNTQLYKYFGAHLAIKNNKKGTYFRIWAPNAKQVFVFGKYKDQKFLKELKKINESIWEVFILNLEKYTIYKYKIITNNDDVLIKADPFAFFSNQHPYFDSIIYDEDNYKWNDEKFIKNRKIKNNLNQPILIYEIHLGSWKKTLDNNFLTYKDYANNLIKYLKKMHYTHVEFMPLFEHPFIGSWGYQITGYFSPTSRYGSPEDLKNLIDKLHQNNIGVILDFVPIHYCKDDHGLANFDGKNIFSYEKEYDRENIEWGTQNFNLSKNEVKSFLLSNLFYWIEVFHIDGFRFDAVSNLIYYGGKIERGLFYDGINFAKHVISLVKQKYQDIIMIAEDSSFYDGVTNDIFSENGIGFNLKWNLGFSNDLFKFIASPFWERLGENFNSLTFSMSYFYKEKFLLAFSHDEVVHLKKSLLNKSFGFKDKCFAQLRLMLFYLITHPGKKLIFMGSEFGQFNEWNESKSLDWHLLKEDEYNLENKKTLIFSQDLFQIYNKNKSLFELDFDPKAFSWLHLDKNNAIWSFIRYSLNPKDFLVVILNFSDKYFENYKIFNLPDADHYIELINTDNLKYAGTGAIFDKKVKIKLEHGNNIDIKIAPLTGIILKPFFGKQKGNK